MTIDEILEAMREVVAQLDDDEAWWRQDYTEKLRATIAALEGIQKDWQLVPKEPTADMVRAFRDAITLLQVKDAYKAMLAAAHKPTGEE